MSKSLRSVEKSKRDAVIDARKEELIMTKNAVGNQYTFHSNDSTLNHLNGLVVEITRIVTFADQPLADVRFENGFCSVVRLSELSEITGHVVGETYMFKTADSTLSEYNGRTVTLDRLILSANEEYDQEVLPMGEVVLDGETVSVFLDELIDIETLS